MAAGMPGTRAAGSCAVKRAAVDQLRQPEWTASGNPALQKWHMRRTADWCGSGAGSVWRVVWAAKSGL